MYKTDREIKIKNYINNYLAELQRHFDVSDKKMRFILYEVYKDMSTIPKIKKFIKKYMSMVKSFCKKKFKKDY